MERDELEWRRRRRRQRQRRRRRNAFRSLLTLMLAVCCFFAAVFAIKFYTRQTASDHIHRLSIEIALRASAVNLASLQETQEQTPEPEPVVEVDPNSIIYLTFDDGPSSQVTPEILDILEQNEVQATFFIMDYSEDKLPILQRALNDGNTIGIHGKSHDYAACYTEENAYLDGVEEVRQKLYEDTGYHAFCIRFPGGSSNTISASYNEGIMTRLAARVDESDLEYYDWNVDSEDATGNGIPAETLAANVTENLVKGRGNVILMHDASSKATTAEALQTIIDYGRANGYCFQAITRDTAPVHHRVFN